MYEASDVIRDLRSGRVPADGSCVVMHGAAGRRQLSAHVAAVNLITLGGPLRAASMARSC